MKIVAIIQARMGSARLPGKMLLEICGKPAIQHVVERVQMVRNIDEIWLATTGQSVDRQLAEWAKNFNIPYYCGSEDDVLDRYYQVALLTKAEIVVRITGDCPLHDYKVIGEVVDTFKANQSFDYVCNVLPPTYPDGLDVEVFSFNALQKTWQEAKLKSEREHVTPYIYKHPEIFKIKNILNKIDLSNYRLTLDTLEDLSLIRMIIGECEKSKGNRDMYEVIKILESHPEWLNLNKRHIRNEGYAKSLLDDKNT